MDQEGQNGARMPQPPPPPPPPIWSTPEDDAVLSPNQGREILPPGQVAGPREREGDQMSQVTALMNEVARLKQCVRDQGRASVEETGYAPSASTRRTSFRVPETYVGEAETRWERDLHRLAKLVVRKYLDPKTEEQYEDALLEWERVCNGAGIDNNVLTQLLLRLGSPVIIWGLESFDTPQMPWKEVKDRLARKLFPYSPYVLELEAEMTREDRTCPVCEALINLSRQFDRHACLCERWGRANDFADGRRKEALLKKVPIDQLEECMRIRNFYTISFNDFVDHYLMVDAAARQAALIRKPKAPGRVAAVTPVLAAGPQIEVAAAASSKHQAAPTAGNFASTATCYNCGEVGHLARNCPKPRPRCGSCGKTGHKTDTCYRTQKEGPHGTTRTGTLRMTKKGVHFELVDEATKRTFFEAMRKYIDQQDS